MRIRYITFIAVVAIFVIAAAAVTMGADLPQASFNPDRILKGTTPIITMTLDKPIADKEIPQTKVSIAGGQHVGVQKSGDKLIFQLPKLNIVGLADVEVINGDKAVAVGRLKYDDSTERNSNGIGLLPIYLLLIFVPVFGFNMYDMVKSYGERFVIIGNLSNNTIEEKKALLAAMKQGPTGFSGLTRGIIALSLILVLAIAIFHLIVFRTMSDHVAEQLLTLLAGSVTSIIGFYFGTKASEAAQTAPSGAGTTGSTVVPKILDVQQPNLAIKKLKVIGEGFGEPQGKGNVKVIDTASKKEVTIAVGPWGDKLIEVQITETLNANAQVDVVVTSDNGKSSEPRTFIIKQKT